MGKKKPEMTVEAAKAIVRSAYEAIREAEASVETIKEENKDRLAVVQRRLEGARAKSDEVFEAESWLYRHGGLGKWLRPPEVRATPEEPIGWRSNGRDQDDGLELESE